jgi:GTP cyclohydrolase II
MADDFVNYFHFAPFWMFALNLLFSDRAIKFGDLASKQKTLLLRQKGIEQLFRIAQRHKQDVTTTLYNRCVSTDFTLRKMAEADFPTRWGQFRIMGFEGHFDAGAAADRRKEEAVALVLGDIHAAAPLVRIHSQCLTGDVFGSLRCDCRQQLEMALSMIAQAGSGVLLYEMQEGRGIGLMAKLQAYELQDQGLDTVQANEELGFKADHREFQLPAEVLKELGLKHVRLLSNNPQKVAALESAGIKVVERVPCEVEAHAASERYLNTKKEKLGHLFTER